MSVSHEVCQQISDILREKFGHATTSQLDQAVAAIVQKTDERKSRNTFSLSTLLRASRIKAGGGALNEKTASADVEYCKALSTGTTPGSYLVPTLQASEIIEYLTTGGIARSAGFRIWPLDGIQKMNVPVATAAPSWIWAAQNSVQTPTDPNLSQMAFDLKERRSLTAVPNQLLQTSVPAFDTLLAELIGLGAAEHEDQAIFSTTTVSGAPTALMAAAGISTLLVGNSANGGSLAFTDILTVLKTAAANKAKGPFVWIASPRTFWLRIVGMLDSDSRPIFVPTLSTGLQATVGRINVTPNGFLFGYPVFVSPAISEVEANGSGTNQSHLIFANPRYCHIAQDNNVELAVSTERFFDSAQTAIRGLQHIDTAYAPAAGITVLLGVN